MYSNENKTRIKVAIITNDFMVGGVQKLILDQVTLLDRNIFSLSIISLSQFPGKGDFYDLVPTDVPIYKLHFRRFFDVRAWVALIRVLRQIQPDIVKASLFFSNIIALVLKPFFGYKVITAEHNTDIARPYHVRFLNKLLSPLAYTIVADSQGVVEHITRTEGIAKEKFTVIYNGVELGEIGKAQTLYSTQKNDIRQEIRLVSNDKIFLNVARLSTQKNHTLMIDAFARIIPNYPDAKLVIIGDGPLREKLEEQIKNLHVEKNVILLGERKDIYRFYAVSDFFLLTSVREGFCIAAMNGLAFGLPLLSTRVSGVSEYLKDGQNGLFLGNDSVAMASKLEVILSLDTTTLEKYKHTAVESAQLFGTDTYINKYNDLFLRTYRGKDSL